MQNLLFFIFVYIGLCTTTLKHRTLFPLTIVDDQGIDRFDTEVITDLSATLTLNVTIPIITATTMPVFGPLSNATADTMTESISGDSRPEIVIEMATVAPQDAISEAKNVIPQMEVSGPIKWDYGTSHIKVLSPRDWHMLYSSCGIKASNEKQSPINLNVQIQDVVHDNTKANLIFNYHDLDLRALSIVKKQILQINLEDFLTLKHKECVSNKLSSEQYSDYQSATTACNANSFCFGVYDPSCDRAAPFSLCSNDTTWQISREDSCIYQKSVQNTITDRGDGPLSGKTYILGQVNFHVGSEHFVNGYQYSLEMQLVHWNRRYKNLNAASGKPEGLAIVSVLFEEADTSNQELQDLLDSFTGFSDTSSFNFNHLFPTMADSNYISYDGSLTTPPCADNVKWIVLKDHQRLSLSQLQTFRALKVGKRSNNRPIQPLNGRKISTSFKPITVAPTMLPTKTPTSFPTRFPTTHPTLFPTISPTLSPTTFPTSSPTTKSPTPSPTAYLKQYPMQCHFHKLSTTIYTTYNLAIVACDETAQCFGIFDPSCDNIGPFFLCGQPSTWLKSAEESCIYQLSSADQLLPSSLTEFPVSSIDRCRSLNWNSKSGHTCADYEARQLCTPNGNYGSGWLEGLYGTFEEWSVEGTDARQACCACGGGNRGSTLVLLPPNVNTATVSPLLAVPTVSPLLAVPTVSPLPAVPTVSPLPTVPTISPLPTVPTISPLPVVPTISSLPAVPTVSPLPTVPTISPLPIVATLSPLPIVATLSPLPIVATLSPLPAVATISPSPAVATISPLPVVAIVSPQPGVATVVLQPEAATVAPQSEVVAIVPQSEVSAERPMSENRVCQDLDWRSKSNHGCSYYAARKLCNPNGTYGDGWKISYGTFQNWGVNGIDASQACCTCGGGVWVPPTPRKCWANINTNLTCKNGSEWAIDRRGGVLSNWANCGIPSRRALCPSHWPYMCIDHWCQEDSSECMNQHGGLRSCTDGINFENPNAVTIATNSFEINHLTKTKVETFDDASILHPLE